jgi:hypothetical protein
VSSCTGWGMSEIYGNIRGSGIAAGAVNLANDVIGSNQRGLHNQADARDGEGDRRNTSRLAPAFCRDNITSSLHRLQPVQLRFTAIYSPSS